MSDTPATCDYLGREVKVNDRLVYPVRRGSSMWLSQATVRQILPGQIKATTPQGRPVTLKNLANIVVVN